MERNRNFISDLQIFILQTVFMDIYTHTHRQINTCIKRLGSARFIIVTTLHTFRLPQQQTVNTIA
jgi:hypothetical protein